MNKQVSSKDVAKEANVSRATVSYVLNNVDRVKIKPETRQKVLQAAKKLGYHPNAIARAMKTGQSMSIGVLSNWHIAHQRFTEVLKGVKDVLGRHAYSITLCSYKSNEQEHPEYYQYYLEKKIDGVILISARETINEDAVAVIRKKKMPVVLADFHYNNPTVPCIDIDYYHGGYTAAKYLIEKGHRHFIYLGPKSLALQERQRISGVKKAFEDAGLNPEELVQISIEEPNKQDDEDIIDVLKNKGNKSAMIISNYIIAFNTLYLANKMGIKVPEELAVISLGGSDFAKYSYPRLSTSDLPLYEMGCRSAQALLDLINNNGDSVHMSLPCRLNIRETC